MSEQSIVINLSAPRPSTSSQSFQQRQTLKIHNASGTPLRADTPTDQEDRKPLIIQGVARDGNLLSYWSDSVSNACEPTNSSPQSLSLLNSTTDHRPVITKANSSCSSTSTISLQTQRCNTNKTKKTTAIRTGVRKRVMANERERERTKSLNQALEILRNKLPLSVAEKRSKIQTLRAAKEYIEFLALQNNEHSTSSLDEDQLTSPDNSGQHQTKTLHNGQATSTSNDQQPDSPLTYKFYKFRLKNRND